jgi:phospholipase D1/2
MLVWDDASTRQWLSALGLTFSAMSTSDEQTARYFRGSKVQCVLCGRNINVISTIGMTEKPQELPVALFSHHQKAIVLDQELPSPSAGGRRQIVSFLGGLDVCDGRYDTQSHSLFRTIGTGQAHGKDFHQANFAEADIGKGGPREPWHDIHSKIEGPAAWDVLHNFEQRWRKQGGGKDLLVDLVALESTVVPSSSPLLLPADDQEAWNVQVLRSIDDNSALGFPATKEAAHEAGIVPGKRQLIDRSIQDAYIHAIRAAKSFIYIENQYFIGSSFQWKADGINPADVGAVNLIPRELSLKIVRKIEAGERFSVYVVVPMWPEGSPTDDNVQATLEWQRRTMEMMYDDIATALRKMKMDDANPRDYLTFFCLGNREVKKSGEYQPAGRPEDGTHYARAQKARRFMIYVHSKLMIGMIHL